MAGTATVTGKVGPGLTVTAAVYTGVASFSLDMVNEVLTLFFQDQRPPSAFDVSAATTYTLTVTAPNTFALTVA